MPAITASACNCLLSGIQAPRLPAIRPARAETAQGWPPGSRETAGNRRKAARDRQQMPAASRFLQFCSLRYILLTLHQHSAQYADREKGCSPPGPPLTQKEGETFSLLWGDYRGERIGGCKGGKRGGSKGGLFSLLECHHSLSRIASTIQALTLWPLAAAAASS